MEEKEKPKEKPKVIVDVNRHGIRRETIIGGEKRRPRKDKSEQ